MNISVIIPTLNEAGIVALSIQRAWQCGANQVIVCDGGSNDSTVEIASASKCQLIQSPAGRGGQLNAGAAAATSDVLLFLHADNWLTPTGCQQIRDCVEEFGTPVFGAFRQRIESSKTIYRLIELGNRLRVSMLSMAYGDQGIFVTKELFDDIGGFPDLPLMEDFSFSQKVKQRGKYRLLEGPLHVSPRRWEQTGPIRQTVSNWLTVMRYTAGVSAERLAENYQRRD